MGLYFEAGSGGTRAGDDGVPDEKTFSATLPTDSQERKDIPIVRGVLDYFPAALAEIAKVSKAGNDKHNPGQPIHHARGKSTDHADSLVRHLLERGGIDADTGLRHSAEMAWRALALLQQELEDAGAPMARGARVADAEKSFDDRYPWLAPTTDAGVINPERPDWPAAGPNYATGDHI